MKHIIQTLVGMLIVCAPAIVNSETLTIDADAEISGTLTVGGETVIHSGNLESELGVSSGGSVIVQDSNSTTAWGWATADGTGATAWGDAYAEGNSSTAWGGLSYAGGNSSTAWGNASAGGSLATAWGSARASGGYSTAWGHNSESYGDYSTAWGRAYADGPYSTAWGHWSTTYGAYSTAWGHSSESHGDYSTAWGHWSITYGAYSTAWGHSSESHGDYSTAWGQASAFGNYSTAFGLYAKANSYASLAFGQYTLGISPGTGGATNWLSSDPVLEIGIGSASNSRANAVTVLKDGRTAIGEHTTADDLKSQVETLQVQGPILIDDYDAAVDPETAATAGAIRFDGSDFKGYDGSAWKSLTSGGEVVADSVTKLVQEGTTDQKIYVDDVTGAVLLSERQGDISMGAFGTGI